MKNKNQLFRVFSIVIMLILVGNANSQNTVYKDLKSLKGMNYKASKVDLDHLGASKTYRSGGVTITEMLGEYLFPSGIDATGQYVIIQTFGTAEESIFWSAETGPIVFNGKGTTINSARITAGDFMNNDFPPGGSAQTAGIYSVDDDAWTFLGMNPDYPTMDGDGYNTAWGMSDDAQTIVGLQLYDSWSAMAFKWTEEDGYTNIGQEFDYDSRASGISRDGSVIYGWTSNDWGAWSPVIWTEDGGMLLVPGGSGEAMAASPEGTYVAGVLDEGPFLWSEAEGVTNFGTWEDYPTCVMEDGSAFGFTGVFPPPVRRAFYKSPEGDMSDFNTYAESRGMENAADWTFYSINNVTPDGDKFIGAGINPSDQDVCFIIDFSEPAQAYELSLVASPEEGGSVSGDGSFLAGEEVSISAVANPVWAFENWTDEEGEIISTDAETTIVMPEGNIILTANFKSTVGVEEIVIQELEMSPNPVVNFLSINNIQEGRLRVFNIQGQLLIDMLVDDHYILDVSNLKSGMYLVSLNTNSIQFQTNFVKR